MKKSTTLRIDDELLEKIKIIRENRRPKETLTNFVEISLWDRVKKLLKRED
jgi:predicted transcriptional regulator